MASPNHRQIFDIRLTPVVGSRFQPTDFPDVGAAVFRAPDGKGGWVDALVVESAQSMANRLEGVGWDQALDEPVEVLARLPYVRVVHADDGVYLTSSRTEAHRLGSAFVKDATLDDTPMAEFIRDRLELREDRPIPPRAIARALLTLDPLCLIHGVFFADRVWPGQPKVGRAVTAFVEAFGVERVESGGVKRDHVRHSFSESPGSASEGYGTIPYHLTDWTAQEIRAMFCIDLAQIRSYGLGDEGTALLTAIARWEVRCLLDGGLRFRTNCDLDLADSKVVDQAGHLLPPRSKLETEIQRLIDACSDQLGDGKPIEVRWSGGRGRKGH